MNLEPLFAKADQRPARAGLVGAGQFGATFVAQSRRIPSLSTVAVCDLDMDRAAAAASAAGFGDAEIVRCEGRAAATAAIQAGKLAIVEDARILAELPLDIVLEATGIPDVAAATAEAAIANGKHSVIATKEAEIVIGPLLAARARAAGVVHTLVDGDQPSLLVGLVGWARLLGLPIVAAGKASESDFVYDPEAGTVTAWDRSVPAPGYADAFAMVGGDPQGRVTTRNLEAFPNSTVPDLCEMGIVANHTGLVPDRPELHAPIARTTELPRLFRPAAHGGLLHRTGVVDMFNCLRRPDEVSFAGGVFVIVEAPDRVTGEVLAGKGIPASEDGRYLMLNNPVHLLGAEAPMSVLAAARLGVSTGGGEVRQRFDLCARAARDLAAGTRLELGERHAVDGLDHLLLPARPIGGEAPVPYYLLIGAELIRPVAHGTVISAADVRLREGGALLRLRREQDAGTTF
jgi:predicted homoserine dehydrogenase-like protein